ncbi:hypothetical protein K504DRAFT_501643 [Pleomassaria siparia CBS 279.74]|uniref:CFEM domain-containing protein n=1 Tax=Pleomassaria siparia CBS 279.74 TaxID=1314801 RepID=A0A6G1KCL1_9PLEO|nr:hypothetical protein K504DRAFT_501643 [Pleomassaria siparia CBS 279.74]
MPPRTASIATSLLFLSTTQIEHSTHRSSISTALFLLLNLSSIQPVWSIPHAHLRHPALPSSDFIHPIRRSQTTFLPPALPSCALQCYITALTTSSICPSESDFGCQCDFSRGNIVAEIGPCIRSRCGEQDKGKAEEVLRGICADVDMDLEKGNGNGGRGGEMSITSTQESKTTSVLAPTNSLSTSIRSLPTSSLSSMTSNTNSPNSSGPSVTPPSPSIPTSTYMPTTPPIAAVPESLSAAAKAGIAISITLLFSTLLLFSTIYIRHLKRELRYAQAAATATQVSELGGESIHDPRNDFASSTIVPRRKSWAGSRRSRLSASRSSSPMSPLSPLSPVFQDGVLKKKRGGQALSLIIERIDEDDRSSMNTGRLSGKLTGRLPAQSEGVINTREPVPGQREGLSEPLELDGVGTGISEMPESVTPRARSRERRDEKDSVDTRRLGVKENKGEQESRYE